MTSSNNIFLNALRCKTRTPEWQQNALAEDLGFNSEMLKPTRRMAKSKQPTVEKKNHDASFMGDWNDSNEPVAKFGFEQTGWPKKTTCEKKKRDATSMGDWNDSHEPLAEFGSLSFEQMGCKRRKLSTDDAISTKLRSMNMRNLSGKRFKTA